jgi:intracellular sulfur oxidation DsrE/DsrF family protein
MKKFSPILLVLIISGTSLFAQHSAIDSLKKVKDSLLRTTIHEDSAKIEKEFLQKEKMLSLISKMEYPLMNGGKFSGIIPVKNPSEIPDPDIDYKLLFELTFTNPDSLTGEINGGLTEITRVINLHYASGIPLKKIMPVIVVHGMAIDAILNNEAYQKKFKKNNPNLSLINDMIKKTGAKIIACGQAMAYFDYTKEELLPDVKISLTAQTVLSHYQLKGYVLYNISEAK